MGRAERWLSDVPAAERSMELVYACWDGFADPEDNALMSEWELFIEAGSIEVSARHVAFLDERYGPPESC